MHAGNQFDLLRQRRFAPFFWTQFLGAGNDNVFKNAFVIFVAFEAATADVARRRRRSSTCRRGLHRCRSCCSRRRPDSSPTSSRSRGSSAGSSSSRSRSWRSASLGFWRQSITLLFAALALLGVHSTLFGPVKYAILPQHLRPEELIGGNGLVEMGTFVAILLGTIAGGLVVAVKPSGPLLAGVARDSAIAVAGWLASRAIPLTPAVAPELAINWNPFTRDVAQPEDRARERRRLARRCSASRGSGSTARSISRSSPRSRATSWAATSTCSRCCWRVFSVGIGVGSLLCERLSGRKVEIGLVPFGSIGLTLFAIDLWLASRHLVPQSDAGVDAFLAQAAHWRVLVDLAAARRVRRLLHRAALRADPGSAPRRRTARGSSPPTTS